MARSRTRSYWGGQPVGQYWPRAAPHSRGIERVALHADLTMLARLSQALARARAVPLAA
jgi:hypothetical protein